VESQVRDAKRLRQVGDESIRAEAAAGGARLDNAAPKDLLAKQVMPAARRRSLAVVTMEVVDPEQAWNRVHAVGPITRRLAETKGHSMLPHQEGDHACAGRGGRRGWRAAKERRYVVPRAQEAERIGVPAPHHRRGPG
jgi:hypothetical protein